MIQNFPNQLDFTQDILLISPTSGQHDILVELSNLLDNSQILLDKKYVKVSKETKQKILEFIKIKKHYQIFVLEQGKFAKAEPMAKMLHNLQYLNNIMCEAIGVELKL
jgi:hypothetical protein